MYGIRCWDPAGYAGDRDGYPSCESALSALGEWEAAHPGGRGMVHLTESAGTPWEDDPRTTARIVPRRELG